MLLKMIQWLLVCLTTAWLVIVFAIGDYLSAFLTAAALVLVAPPTQRLIAPRLPRILSVRFVQLVAWFGLIVLALIAAPAPPEQAATTSEPAAPQPVSARQAAETLSSDINRFASIADLKTALQEDAKLDGKTLVMLKSSSVISGESINIIDRDYLNYVPKELIPATAAEVKYLAWLECSSEEAGRYTNGAVGYRRICSVSIIDWASKSIIAKSDKFIGSDPPASTTSESAASGDLPETELRNYLASLL